MIPPLSDSVGFSLFPALQADISLGVCQIISFYCLSLLGASYQSLAWRERGREIENRSNTGKLYILLRDFVLFCLLLGWKHGLFFLSAVGFKAGFYCHITPLVITSLGRVERNGTFCCVCCSLESPVSFFFLFFFFSIFDFWFALGFCALQWYYNAYWVVVYLGCFSFWLDRQTGMISRWASFFDSFNPRWSPFWLSLVLE